VKTGVGKLKAAVTAAAAGIVTEQVPVPVHAPPQPAKIDPLPGGEATRLESRDGDRKFSLGTPENKSRQTAKDPLANVDL
jgi:hypothetical protein